MIQFYCPDIKSNPVLPESDSGHAVRVLRMKEGDPLQVVDGKGHIYSCVLTCAHPKHAAVEIVAEEEQPNPWTGKITVAVAPTKNMDRMEWLTEKLTEIGVDRIVPLKCRRSERKELKADRLEKVAVAAMKQSLKTVLPDIAPMTRFADFIGSQLPPHRFICFCDERFPRVELATACVPGEDTVILIGPEGDFAPEEVEAALAAGFIPVALGPCRLRTETAALVAADTLHILSLTAAGK